MARKLYNMVPVHLGKCTVTICHECKSVVEIGEWGLQKISVTNDDNCKTSNIEIGLFKYEGRLCPYCSKGRLDGIWRFDSEENAEKYAQEYEHETTHCHIDEIPRSSKLN